MHQLDRYITILKYKLTCNKTVTFLKQIVTLTVLVCFTTNIILPNLALAGSYEKIKEQEDKEDHGVMPSRTWATVQEVQEGEELTEHEDEEENAVYRFNKVGQIVEVENRNTGVTTKYSDDPETGERVAKHYDSDGVEVNEDGSPLEGDDSQQQSRSQTQTSVMSSDEWHTSFMSADPEEQERMAQEAGVTKEEAQNFSEETKNKVQNYLNARAEDIDDTTHTAEGLGNVGEAIKGFVDRVREQTTQMFAQIVRALRGRKEEEGAEDTSISIEEIQQAAAEEGIDLFAGNTDISGLAQALMEGSLIAHLNLEDGKGAFIIVTGVQNGNVSYIDSDGETRVSVSIAEFISKWSGKILGLKEVGESLSVSEKQETRGKFFAKLLETIWNLFREEGPVLADRGTKGVKTEEATQPDTRAPPAKSVDSPGVAQGDSPGVATAEEGVAADEPEDVVADSSADVDEPGIISRAAQTIAKLFTADEEEVDSPGIATVEEPEDVVADSSADVDEPEDVVADSSADVEEPEDVVADLSADVELTDAEQALQQVEDFLLQFVSADSSEQAAMAATLGVSVDQIANLTVETVQTILNYLQAQGGYIINCAVQALANLFMAENIDFNIGDVAANTILADIITGNLQTESTEDYDASQLQLSMFAIQKTAALYGVDLTGYNYADFTALAQAVANGDGAIVFMDLGGGVGHFVMVTDVSDGNVTYTDVDGQSYTVSQSEFSNKWNGKVLSQNRINAERLSTAQLKSTKGAFWGAVFAAILNAIIQAVIQAIIKSIIEVLVMGDTDFRENLNEAFEWENFRVTLAVSFAAQAISGLGSDTLAGINLVLDIISLGLNIYELTLDEDSEEDQDELEWVEDAQHVISIASAIVSIAQAIAESMADAEITNITADNFWSFILSGHNLEANISAAFSGLVIQSAIRQMDTGYATAMDQAVSAAAMLWNGFANSSSFAQGFFQVLKGFADFMLAMEQYQYEEELNQLLEDYDMTREEYNDLMDAFARGERVNLEDYGFENNEYDTFSERLGDMNDARVESYHFRAYTMLSSIASIGSSICRISAMRSNTGGSDIHRVSESFRIQGEAFSIFSNFLMITAVMSNDADTINVGMRDAGTVAKIGQTYSTMGSILDNAGRIGQSKSNQSNQNWIDSGNVKFDAEEKVIAINDAGLKQYRENAKKDMEAAGAQVTEKDLDAHMASVKAGYGPKDADGFYNLIDKNNALAVQYKVTKIGPAGETQGERREFVGISFGKKMELHGTFAVEDDKGVHRVTGTLRGGTISYDGVSGTCSLDDTKENRELRLNARRTTGHGSTGGAWDGAKGATPQHVASYDPETGELSDIQALAIMSGGVKSWGAGDVQLCNGSDFGGFPVPNAPGYGFKMGNNGIFDATTVGVAPDGSVGPPPDPSRTFEIRKEVVGRSSSDVFTVAVDIVCTVGSDGTVVSIDLDKLMGMTIDYDDGTSYNLLEGSVFKNLFQNMPFGPFRHFGKIDFILTSDSTLQSTSAGKTLEGGRIDFNVSEQGVWFLPRDNFESKFGTYGQDTKTTSFRDGHLDLTKAFSLSGESVLFNFNGGVERGRYSVSERGQEYAGNGVTVDKDLHTFVSKDHKSTSRVPRDRMQTTGDLNVTTKRQVGDDPNNMQTVKGVHERFNNYEVDENGKAVGGSKTTNTTYHEQGGGATTISSTKGVNTEGDVETSCSVTTKDADGTSVTTDVNADTYGADANNGVLVLADGSSVAMMGQANSNPANTSQPISYNIVDRALDDFTFYDPQQNTITNFAGDFKTTYTDKGTRVEINYLGEVYTFEGMLQQSAAGSLAKARLNNTDRYYVLDIGVEGNVRGFHTNGFATATLDRTVSYDVGSDGQLLSYAVANIDDQSIKVGNYTLGTRSSIKFEADNNPVSVTKDVSLYVEHQLIDGTQAKITFYLGMDEKNKVVYKAGDLYIGNEYKGFNSPEETSKLSAYISHLKSLTKEYKSENVGAGIDGDKLIIEGNKTFKVIGKDSKVHVLTLSRQITIDIKTGSQEVYNFVNDGKASEEHNGIYDLSDGKKQLGIMVQKDGTIISVVGDKGSLVAETDGKTITEIVHTQSDSRYSYTAEGKTLIAIKPYSTWLPVSGDMTSFEKIFGAEVALVKIGDEITSYRKVGDKWEEWSREDLEAAGWVLDAENNRIVSKEAKSVGEIFKGEKIRTKDGGYSVDGDTMMELALEAGGTIKFLKSANIDGEDINGNDTTSLKLKAGAEISAIVAEGEIKYFIEDATMTLGSETLYVKAGIAAPDSKDKKVPERPEVETNAVIQATFAKDNNGDEKHTGYAIANGQVSIIKGQLVVIGKGTVFKQYSTLADHRTVAEGELTIKDFAKNGAPVYASHTENAFTVYSDDKGMIATAEYNKNGIVANMITANMVGGTDPVSQMTAIGLEDGLATMVLEYDDKGEVKKVVNVSGRFKQTLAKAEDGTELAIFYDKDKPKGKACIVPGVDGEVAGYSNFFELNDEGMVEVQIQASNKNEIVLSAKSTSDFKYVIRYDRARKSFSLAKKSFFVKQGDFDYFFKLNEHFEFSEYTISSRKDGAVLNNFEFAKKGSGITFSADNEILRFSGDITSINKYTIGGKEIVFRFALKMEDDGVTFDPESFNLGGSYLFDEEIITALRAQIEQVGAENITDITISDATESFEESVNIVLGPKLKVGIAKVGGKVRFSVNDRDLNPEELIFLRVSQDVLNDVYKVNDKTYVGLIVQDSGNVVLKAIDENTSFIKGKQGRDSRIEERKGLLRTVINTKTMEYVVDIYNNPELNNKLKLREDGGVNVQILTSDKDGHKLIAKGKDDKKYLLNISNSFKDLSIVTSNFAVEKRQFDFQYKVSKTGEFLNYKAIAKEKWAKLGDFLFGDIGDSITFDADNKVVKFYADRGYIINRANYDIDGQEIQIRVDLVHESGRVTFRGYNAVINDEKTFHSDLVLAFKNAINSIGVENIKGGIFLDSYANKISITTSKSHKYFNVYGNEDTITVSNVITLSVLNDGTLSKVNSFSINGKKVTAKNAAQMQDKYGRTYTLTGSMDELGLIVMSDGSVITNTIDGENTTWAYGGAISEINNGFKTVYSPKDGVSLYCSQSVLQKNGLAAKGAEATNGWYKIDSIMEQSASGITFSIAVKENKGRGLIYKFNSDFSKITAVTDEVITIDGKDKGIKYFVENGRLVKMTVHGEDVQIDNSGERRSYKNYEVYFAEDGSSHIRGESWTKKYIEKDGEIISFTSAGVDASEMSYDKEGKYKSGKLRIIESFDTPTGEILTLKKNIEYKHKNNKTTLKGQEVLSGRLDGELLENKSQTIEFYDGDKLMRIVFGETPPIGEFKAQTASFLDIVNAKVSVDINPESGDIRIAGVVRTLGEGNDMLNLHGTITYDVSTGKKTEKLILAFGRINGDYFESKLTDMGNGQFKVTHPFYSKWHYSGTINGVESEYLILSYDSNNMMFGVKIKQEQGVTHSGITLIEEKDSGVKAKPEQAKAAADEEKKDYKLHMHAGDKNEKGEVINVSIENTGEKSAYFNASILTNEALKGTISNVIFTGCDKGTTLVIDKDIIFKAEST